MLRKTLAMMKGLSVGLLTALLVGCTGGIEEPETSGCIPNEQRSCGVHGVQSCASDGSGFRVCVESAPAVQQAPVQQAPVKTSPTEPAPVCNPGDFQQCSAGAESGERVCLRDGTGYGSCVADAPPEEPSIPAPTPSPVPVDTCSCEAVTTQIATCRPIGSQGVCGGPGDVCRVSLAPRSASGEAVEIGIAYPDLVTTPAGIQPESSCTGTSVAFDNDIHPAEDYVTNRGCTCTRPAIICDLILSTRLGCR
jgi:hypothetical protein